MKKEYSKPEIETNAYSEFENVLTHACTKQSASKGCRYYPTGHPYADPALKGNGVDDFGDKLVGVTDWVNDCGS